MAVIRRVIAAAIGGLLSVSQLAAQGGTGTISGRVIDSNSQSPLSSVTVMIEGTQRGTLTGNNGQFVLANVPAGAAKVRVARIGFTAQS